MIISTLDAEFLKLQADGAATEPEKVKEEELSTKDSYQNTEVTVQEYPGQKMDVEDGGDGHSAKPFPGVHDELHLTTHSSDCNDLKGKEEELVQSREEMNCHHFSPCSGEEGGDRVKGKKDKNSKWVVVG